MRRQPPVYREKAPYIKKEIIKRILVYTEKGVQYTEENFYDFLQTMIENNLSPAETSKLKNMPSVSWINSFRHKDKRYDKHFMDAINSLPCPVQAKAKKLSQECIEAMRKERAKGTSFYKIAEKYGFSAMTAHKRTRDVPIENDGVQHREIHK